MATIRLNYLLLLLILLALPSEAAGKVLIITSSLTEIDLGSYTEWAHDPAQEWSISEAQDADLLAQKDTSFGRVEGNLWIRFAIENTDNKDLSLIFDSGDEHTETIELFVVNPENGQVIQHAINGIRYRLSQRPIHSLNIAFPILIQADSRRDIYLRVQSRFLVSLAPKLYAVTEFIKTDKIKDQISLIFYGICFGIFLYNCIFALYVREPQYLQFIIFLFSWVLFVSSMDGFIYQVWPYGLLGSYPPWMFYCFFGFTFIAMANFTISYLQLKGLHPIWHNIQRAIIVYGCFIIIGPTFLSYDTVWMSGLILLFLSACINITIGCMVYRTGQRFALEYTLSFGLMLLTLFTLAIFAYDETLTITRTVLLCPALLFSIGIGNRINHLKNEALHLQKNAELANYAADFKSRFLATMSHEIRTPMNGVLGMVEMLKDTKLDKSQQQYLDIINTSGRALLAVINDILDFSKLESGHIILENISIKTESLVDECIGIFLTAKRDRNIEFTTYISPDLPQTFIADPTRIKQVLINLIGNAFKFTSEGEIALTVSEQSIDDKHFIQFSVSDTGTGITQEAIENLFNPFSQADDSITRKFGGTGLGLAISQQLVSTMGGNIEVESEYGKGTIFSFKLPLVVGAETDDSNERQAKTSLQGTRLLIVDDHVPFTLSTSSNLSRWGLEVDTTNSAEEALTLLKEKPYDLMLLDILLPDGNGIEFVDKFRFATKHSAMKIISISAGSEIPSSDILNKYGISCHLMKPFQFSTLHQAIEESLGLSLNEEIASAPLPDLSNIHLLIAEDNPTNQLVIKSLLNKLNVSFELVENGKLAYESFRASFANEQKTFNAILMDCEMPVMDGFTATGAIRNFENTHPARLAIPIIGLSAHALEEFRQKALDMGMSHYLTKPIALSELRSVLIGFCLHDGVD